MRVFIGIDPGASGGVVVMDEKGTILKIASFAKHTPVEMVAVLREHVHYDQPHAALESVHAMPKQGVSSTFKFGHNAGWWEGVLAALEIPLTEHPSPQTWQKAMGCLSKGDKNVTKRRAHQLFPEWSKELTHAVADASLICEWLRRKVVMEMREVPS